MPETVYPGAYWDPGVNAGYNAGWNRLEVVKCHFTVGVDSRPVGRRGYFQWLVSRDGTVTQFAPVNALCWDSGEWNDNGPGIEVEYYAPQDDAIFTDAARTACGGLVHWLHDEWGFPLVYWDDGRIVETTGFRGFIAHRDLVQTEQHTDFWPQVDWDLMIQGAVDVGLDLTKAEDLTVWREAYYNQEGAWPTTENGVPVTIDYHKPVIMAKLDEILAALSAGTGGTGGFTEAQIKQWIAEGVRAELDKTKLAH